MTAPADALAPHAAERPVGAPDAEFVVAPDSAEAAAQVFRTAAEHRMRVLIWGGGTHQGFGHPVPDPDVLLLTRALSGVEDWQPDDLTLVVGAGTPVAVIDGMLDERSQTAVLPEHPGSATIGGVVATGVSGHRRLRYGPTRDRVLEVVIATGDGRVVRGGGRLVKNVTGYDLPRLATGSLGSFGMVTSVCLKLWPRPGHEVTVRVDDPHSALHTGYRPLAVLETEAGSFAYFGGTEAEITGQAAALGGEPIEGLAWPAPLASRWVLLLRLPPRSLAAGVARVADLPDVSFRAAHGVGEIRIGVDTLPVEAIEHVRGWAEALGGSLVVAARPDESLLDPWGTPPPTVELQRRVKAAFDPAGVANPGRLPGGI